MTLTLSASEAFLKRKYPGGRPPSLQFSRFPMVASVSKEESWDGDDRVIAMNLEDPQGVGADFAAALGSIQAGSYQRMLPERVEYFGIARVRGHALRAAKTPGALMNIWQNETDGVMRVVMMMLEIQAFGNGSGVLGAATFSSTTATLSTTSDSVNFCSGMRVGAVSDATLTPTARTGYNKITNVDRSAGTLTGQTAWTTAITGLTNGDYLLRAGDSAGGSGNTGVPIGLQQYVVGGSSPGTLWGYDRTNNDPLRSAGQNYNATGQTYNDAIVEAEALLQQQGYEAGMEAWFHPRDQANWKKTLDGKVIYTRKEVKATAGVSFSSIEYDGDGGVTRFRTSPWCPRNQVFWGMRDEFKLASCGPAPQLLDFDNNKMLRVATDDAYEARFGLYGNFIHDAPGHWIRITNFGA